MAARTPCTGGRPLPDRHGQPPDEPLAEPSVARDRAQYQKPARESIACLLERYRFENLQPQLKEIGDLERILARIGLRNARPRDLARLRDALAALPTCRTP